MAGHGWKMRVSALINGGQNRVLRLLIVGHAELKIMETWEWQGGNLVQWERKKGGNPGCLAGQRDTGPKQITGTVHRPKLT